MPVARLHRISAGSPDDTVGLRQAIAAGQLDPAGIIAIFGKTEGNGLVNDFSRGLAVRALTALLDETLGPERAAQVCLVMSGGTEGGLAPHWTVFERQAAAARSEAHTSELQSLMRISYAVFG